jgi:hypothetical protein
MKAKNTHMKIADTSNSKVSESFKSKAFRDIKNAFKEINKGIYLF